MTASTLPLGELVSISGGGTPSKSIPAHFDGKVPWVTPKDMKAWEIWDSQDHISESAIANSAAKMVPPGSVLVVVRSGVLKHSLPIAINRVSVAVNQDLKVLTCGPKLVPEYLARYLQFAAPRLLGFVRGTTADNIPVDELRALDVPILPLPEQRRIADILDKADAVRRRRKDAITLTEEVPRSAFLEMFGDPVTNPKEWDSVAFDSIVQETQLGLVRAASEQDDHRAFPYVRMNAIRSDGHLDLRNVTRVDASENELRTGCLRDGDFLFNTRNSRELVGKAAVFHADGNYLFNNNILRVRFRAGIEPDFVAAYWQTRAAQRELESRKAGTTSVFAIYYKSLATLPVPVPPSRLQRRYADICACVRRTLQAHAAAERASTELSDSLVQRAFRGELGQG